MKKLFFASLACLMALTAQAQVMTSATIDKVYKDAALSNAGEFAYNVERQKDGAISAMYVYRQESSRLLPAYRYEYAYDEQGNLTSRVSYCWVEALHDWACTGRLDYSLQSDSYTVEYSRWNARTTRFDRACDRMTYSLLTEDSINHVCCYHRDRGTAPFELVSESRVTVLPFYQDGLLTQQK